MAAEAITGDTVRRIAGLSRIELSQDKAEAVAGDFSRILDLFGVIRSAPARDAPDPLPQRGRDHLREDRGDGRTLGQEAALRIAPAAYEGHFRVPAVLAKQP